MPIQTIPESFLHDIQLLPDLFVYDYRMTADVVKSKVDVSLNLFSFLQTGQKKVHFADTFAAVNEHQSILIKNGNCLMTELLNDDMVYYCKLFFFSETKVTEFLQKHVETSLSGAGPLKKQLPFFVIENDDYIKSFVQSLSSLMYIKSASTTPLLSVKFEEIMLYLLHKYGSTFLQYINALIDPSVSSSFKSTVENYACSNLKLEEIAFLCNMSLSTFKRHFLIEYNVSPGKWLQQKRLQKAKYLLQQGLLKPSEIYSDFGYNNLSNFSTAFKNEFGRRPSDLV